MKNKIIIIAMTFCLLVVITPSRSELTNTDPRYCGGEPKRNAAGKIVRNIAERKRFETLYPLPIQYKRNEWQVDHVIPLAVGGCDLLINMQWLPKSIKTCAGDMCKDRFERIIYKSPRSF